MSHLLKNFKVQLPTTPQSNTPPNSQSIFNVLKTLTTAMNIPIPDDILWKMSQDTRLPKILRLAKQELNKIAEL